jgi:hypothetical protein
MATKLSLIGYTPPMPEAVETKKPEWTPAVVKLMFGAIFKDLYGSDKELFEGVNIETAAYGNPAYDHAFLVEKAVEVYREKSGELIPKKDYARIGRGLNQWMKDNNMSRFQRRMLARQAAIAALPPAAE